VTGVEEELRNRKYNALRGGPRFAGPHTPVFIFNVFMKLGYVKYILLGVVFFLPLSGLCEILNVNSGFETFNLSLGMGATETETSYTIANQIYDKLLDMDTKGRIVPLLATEWRYIDPKTLEFKLRKGIQFHNGERFDARSVKFSLEYFIKQHYFVSKMLNPIEKVIIIDPYTVRIKTRVADGLLLPRLAFWGFMFPYDYVRKNGVNKIDSNPVGSGPYILDSVVKNKRITLVKNKNYWNKEIFLFDKVNIHCKLEEDDLTIDHRNEMDIIVNAEAGSSLHYLKSNQYVVKKIPSFYEIFGIFNLRNVNSPVQDVRVRKAINYAIDRDALQRLVIKGNGRILATLSMPGEIGYDKNTSKYKYDLYMAKKLLAEAGYKKGINLRIGLQPDLAADSNYVKFLKACLKQANIRPEIDRKFNLSMIIETNTTPDSNAGFWNGDILIGGDPSPYLHSDFIIYQFFVRGALFNMFDNNDFESLYRDASTELDKVLQDLKYQKLNRFIYDNALALFLNQQIRIYIVKKTIDYDPPVNGMLNLRYARRYY